jgi:hypothetical protein
MKAAPNIVGGNAVLAYSPIDHRHRPTGGCRQIVAGVLQGPAAGLAICQCNGGNDVYLFGCDEDWQTKTDTWHESIKAAMVQAEFEYEGVSKTWLNHEPAWVDLDDDNAVWDLFCEQFKFKPRTTSSDWPGIIETKNSVTFGISDLFDGSEAARMADQIGLNVEMLNLFRQCIVPGERLYALDWQHPSYNFNPFGQFEFSPTYSGMVPVIPDGDYNIFLADDRRFGMFGHPWEQTICVFGQPLLDVVMRERPKLLQLIVRRDGQAV